MRPPLAPGFDRTRAFLRAPYTFIGTTCERLGSDFFETRLFLGRAICLRGRAAADLFYDDERFERHCAAPEWLLGPGRMLGFGPSTNRSRKTRLLSLLDARGLARAQRLLSEEWALALPFWGAQGKVVLHGELQTVLTRVACAWAGVPLPEIDVDRRTRDLASVASSAVGIGTLERLRAQRRINAWLRGLIRTARSGGPADDPDCALERLARSELDERAAAAELRALIAPMVALSADIVFLALALHQHPHKAPTTKEERLAFIREVRRFYPFVPAIAARVQRDFWWRGVTFRAGHRVLLDIYGTNHGRKSWPGPNEFRPERFVGAPPGPPAFLPSGDYERGPDERSAGERLTLALLDMALLQLLVFTQYRVPAWQDLHLDMRRVPALPRSHLVLQDVGRRALTEGLGRRMRESGITTTTRSHELG